MRRRCVGTALLVFVGLLLTAIAAYTVPFGNAVAAGSGDAAAAAGDAEATGAEAEEAWDWRELGEATFAKHCAACHGTGGEGMPGVFPALKGNEFVMGDPKAVVRVPMNGRGGMPRFRDTFSDEEFAAVLSYVRNSWGNEADAITPEIVADVRKEKE